MTVCSAVATAYFQQFVHNDKCRHLDRKWINSICKLHVWNGNLKLSYLPLYYTFPYHNSVHNKTINKHYPTINQIVDSNCASPRTETSSSVHRSIASGSCVDSVRSRQSNRPHQRLFANGEFHHSRNSRFSFKRFYLLCRVVCDVITGGYVSCVMLSVAFNLWLIFKVMCDS